MFNRSTHTIAQTDPAVWAAIQAEHQRQEDHIELIASENYASPAVLEAADIYITTREGSCSAAVDAAANAGLAVRYGLDPRELLFPQV